MSDAGRDSALSNPGDDRLAIAPSTQRILTVLGPFAVGMVLLGVIELIRHRSAAEVLLSWALIAAALAVTILVWLWGRRTRMFVGGGQVGYTGFRGKDTVFATKEVRKVMERQVILSGRRPTSVVYLLGANNEVLFQLNRRIWGPDLDRFLKRIGRQVESDPTPIKVNDLLRQLKGGGKG